jgi:F0F1-type ATP synthase epsilon subunit
MKKVWWVVKNGVAELIGETRPVECGYSVSESNRICCIASCAEEALDIVTERILNRKENNSRVYQESKRKRDALKASTPRYTDQEFDEDVSELLKDAF